MFHGRNSADGTEAAAANNCNVRIGRSVGRYPFENLFRR